MAAARSGSAPAKADTEEKAAGGKGKKVDAEEWFRRAVEFVRTSSAPGTSAKVAMPKLSRDEQLRFYALFKQATEGPCAEPAPSRLQVVARMKWCEQTTAAGEEQERTPGREARGRGGGGG